MHINSAIKGGVGVVKVLVGEYKGIQCKHPEEYVLETLLEIDESVASLCDGEWDFSCFYLGTDTDQDDVSGVVAITILGAIIGFVAFELLVIFLAHGNKRYNVQNDTADDYQVEKPRLVRQMNKEKT